MLGMLKVIPMLLAFLAILNTMFGFLGIDCSIISMREVNENMESGNMNTGFTFTNSDLKEALVVVGPYTSGAEFQNTFAHEAYHLAAAIASSLGIELDSETPAYITGDLTLELIDVICELGCTHCNKF